MSAVFVAVLVAAGAQALVAGPAGAQSNAPKPARDLPALASERPAPPEPEVPTKRFEGLDHPAVAPHPSEADALNRRPRPSAFDPGRSTRVESETTPTKKVYANPDGTRTAQLSSRPLRYRDESGTWKDFDLTLAPGADNALAARAAPQAARLATRAGAAVAVVDTDAGAITLGHPQATPATVVIDEARRRATYPKAIAGGRDLVLELTPDGFKENVVLADASASPAYLDQFTLPAGVSARQAGDVVEFVGSGGDVVARFAGGIAFDASFPGGGLAVATPVAVRLVPPPPDSAGAASSPGTTVATVEVSIDAGWLGARGRQFPVTIDPVFHRHAIAASGGRDTYVTSGPEWPIRPLGPPPRW